MALAIVFVGVSCSPSPPLPCDSEGCTCTSASDCTAAECVGPAGSDRVCRAPTTVVGGCCFGFLADGTTCAGEAADVVGLPLNADGCAEGLVCVGEVNTGVDGSPREPICVHETDRAEGERCNVGLAECAEGLVCAFAEGACRRHDCDTNDDCDAGQVCMGGSTAACASSCGAPAAIGQQCFLDAVESCGLDHPCVPEAECVIEENGTCQSA